MTLNNHNTQLLRYLQASPEVQREIDQLLDNREKARAGGQSGPLLVNLTEAAKLLRVGRTTIWRMVKSGKLQVVHIRGCSRIRRSDVEALIKGGTP